ncbi:TPA: glycoside hydrolase family 3 C-terminal domain-containing protein [Streptococcus suis]
MKTKRKKMSNKWFRIITIPVLILFLVFGVVGTSVAFMLESTLDTYLGKGKTKIVEASGTELWDSMYYTKLYQTSEEAKQAAYNTAYQVAAEGTTLLKNKELLPLEKNSKIIPFGKAFLDPNYGQQTSGGSAKWVVNPVTPEEGLSDFTIDTSAIEKMKEAGEPEVLGEAEGTLIAGEAGSLLGGDSQIYEYNPSIYESIQPIKDSTGIVFISRQGQEGQDMKYDAYSDGTPHYLALSTNEKETIRQAKRIASRVIVVLVSSAPMEVSPLQSGELEADALLWMGHPGERGFSVLSAILTGEINPSGRTVDIYPTDFTKDPTYKNIGNFSYSNVQAEKPGYMGDELTQYDRLFTEYQEGVYMGYRFYETADEVDPEFIYGNLDKNGAVVNSGAVAYPFGYGLSYTEFRQELTELQVNGNQITAKVKVTNTGKYEGKETVQLYYSAPYTQFDIENKIEKPVVNLIAFSKTELLGPNESQEITLSFKKDDMSSYSYLHENPNGTKGAYVLEEGDYMISLRKNSHDIWDQKAIHQTETIWYDGSDNMHIRESEKEAQSRLDESGTSLDIPKSEDSFVAASNQFQASSDYMNSESVILSRSDWKGTQPETIQNRTKELSEKFMSLFGKETTFDVEIDPELGNVEGSYVYSAEMPALKEKNGLKLSDLRGLPYDDPMWDQLLNQLDWDADKKGILMNFAGAAYATGQIESIGLPATEEYDGANGLKVKGGDNGYDMTKSSSFAFPPLMAATWNLDLMYEVGKSLGQEALHHNINGWYAPGVNLHRSVFSGRVFEYYSEDPILSGYVAERVISGAGDQGMFSYIKHFALNETETGRDKLSNYWADEQTMRELYLKAFEIPIQKARMTIRYTSDEEGNVSTKTIRAATALMPAQNGVGTIVGHANYNLLTNILRKEWGFEGVVVTDYWVWGKNNMRDLTLRAGSDTYLSNYMPSVWNLVDYESPTARNVMRNAIHNLAYTVVNSNAMQGLAPGSTIENTLSPWKYMLLFIDILLTSVIGLGIYWIIWRTKDERKNPEKYKRKNKKLKNAA